MCRLACSFNSSDNFQCFAWHVGKKEQPCLSHQGILGLWNEGLMPNLNFKSCEAYHNIILALELFLFL